MLTDQQKEFIRNHYDKTPNLIELTRRAFNDDSLDGRTKEGRAVREFMLDEALEYATTKHQLAKPVKLTQENKEFVERYAQEGMSAYEIARIIFPEDKITPLSKQTLVIADYIKENDFADISFEESAILEKYSPPRLMSSLIKRVNDYTGNSFKESELNMKTKKSLESLIGFLDAPRFNQVINNYRCIHDRELFEAEFIRTTWDKPDLTVDEINLYINVCVDYINLKNISSHMEKLNHMFDEAQDQQEMTVRLAELLKTKSEEYNQCEKRMESLIQKLNGDRAKRINSQKQETASVLSLVNLFQEENERNIMIKMAEMQKEAIGEEAGRMEDMPAWKARVLGVSKQDVI